MDHRDPTLAASDRSMVQGWVVDMACLRTYPEDDYVQPGQGAHDRLCAHGTRRREWLRLGRRGWPPPPARSGGATSQVVALLEDNDAERGVYLRAERRLDEDEMVTDSAAPATAPL